MLANERRAIEARLPIGFRNGTMVVVGVINTGLRVSYEVVCDCGVAKTTIKQNFIRAKSCGCMTKALISSAQATHGQTDTPTWRSWNSMFDRCYRKTHKSWPNYGGRGIKVCKRWHKFENFLADMGERPDGTQLDRFPNNSGGYKSGNCRWATPRQNCNNRRSSVLLTYDGKTMSISEWARVVRIHEGCIWKRLHSGWSVRDALTKRPKAQKNSIAIHRELNATKDDES